MDLNLFQNYQNQRWSFVDYKKDEIDLLKQHYKLNDTMAKVLLHNVGSSDLEQIDSLLTPSEDLHTNFDGFCEPNQLELAAKRIRYAQKNNQTIFINGDPDADGICGTAILTAGLRQLGIKCEYVFPIRPLEGHGLQVRIIDLAKKAKSSLIITTDCGTKDVEAVEYANKHNIDVIITDHHILGTKLPNAHALINPFTVKKESMFRSISGASVAFKFIQSIYDYLNIELPDYLFEFGLVVSALGSLSDRVSLKNPLNRLIVKAGVSYFFNSDREGLKALKDISMKSDSTTMPRHLSRTVIPRLNAPGRIGNPDENIPDSTIAVDLLLLGKGKRNKAKASKISEMLQSVFSKNEQEKANLDVTNAYQVASDVDSINEKRKLYTAKIEDEMDVLIDEQVNPESDRVIILEGEDWNSGVIGIDADRLKERFLRPAIILNSKSDSDYVRGSARSIPRIDIYSAIERVEDLYFSNTGKRLFQMEVKSFGETKLVNAFGGHSQACGFTLHRKDVDAFKTMLNEQMQNLKPEDFEYHYDVIDTLTPDQINKKLINDLDCFSPFGQRFEFPIFYMEDCILKGGKVFGNKYQKSLKKHVNFLVSGSKTENRQLTFDAVGFGLWNKFCFVKENSSFDKKIDLIFRVEIDPKSKGNASKKRIRLNVLDIRVSKKENPDF